jgi:hypothetical protein
MNKSSKQSRVFTSSKPPVVSEEELARYLEEVSTELDCPETRELERELVKQ